MRRMVCELCRVNKIMCLKSGLRVYLQAKNHVHVKHTNIFACAWASLYIANLVHYGINTWEMIMRSSQDDERLPYCNSWPLFTRHAVFILRNINIWRNFFYHWSTLWWHGSFETISENTGSCVFFIVDTTGSIAGLILDLQPVNEKRRYKVTPPLIGWEQT